MPSRAPSSSAASPPHGRGITKSASSPALSAAFPGVELQRSQRSQRSQRNPRKDPRSQRHGVAAKSRGDPERILAHKASDTTAPSFSASSSSSSPTSVSTRPSSSASATCAPPLLSTYTSKKSREVAALASGSPGFDVNETRCSDVRFLVSLRPLCWGMPPFGSAFGGMPPCGSAFGELVGPDKPQPPPAPPYTDLILTHTVSFSYPLHSLPVRWPFRPVSFARCSPVFAPPYCTVHVPVPPPTCSC
jgi:hypothetical protein